VWQWCQDNFDSKYYSSSVSIDPAGPESGDESQEFYGVKVPAKVLRGGSFLDTADMVRATARSAAPAAHRGINIGFRVAVGLRFKVIFLTQRHKVTKARRKSRENERMRPLILEPRPQGSDPAKSPPCGRGSKLRSHPNVKCYIARLHWQCCVETSASPSPRVRAPRSRPTLSRWERARQAQLGGSRRRQHFYRAHWQQRPLPVPHRI